MIEMGLAVALQGAPRERDGKGRTEAGGRPPSGDTRASDLGEDARGKFDTGHESRSEQSRLIDIAEFNIARHVAYRECGHFEFCRLDSLVIQPYAHVAHQQPDRTAGKRRDTNEH